MVDEQNANRIAELKNRMSRMNAPPVLVNGVSVEDPANKTLVGKLKAVGGKLKKEFKEHAMPYVALGAVVGSLAVGWLTYDHLSKRQHVAERNVTYRTSHTLYIAGNKEKKAAEKADRESITQVQEGGGVESKVGSYLAEIHREVRGDIEYYKMFNTQQKRIASTDQKPERFQAGWRLRGSINFKEQFAKLDSDKENSKIKGASKYMVYKYDPERGRKQFDVDVVEYPVDGGLGKNELGIVETKANGEQDKRVMVNRLVEKRNLLGFFFGDFYRTGTILEDFVASPENQALATQFFKAVRGIDGTESINPKVREKLADEMVAITERMEKQPIYSTFEDGYLKLLPQESTMYLGENPGTLQRFTQWLGINRGKSNILRVENHWDLFPGSWMGLKTVKLGEGKNRNYLFDKYNNGGYTLKDKFGDIARIDIQDFFLSYGNDVVYHYYLDLNGNGKIDRPNKLLNAVRTLLGKPKITYDELIGSVLCKPTHDEIVELENIAKGINPESDLTFSSNYSYMASPRADMKNAEEYFKYGAYMETMIPDQIHRGFGQHSVLGLVNDQRSDIMLYNDLNVGNFSRALTQESTLVAKHDIIKLLNATKRPYAQDLAKKYNIESEFEGKFPQRNSELRQKIYVGPLPWILAGAGALAYRKIRNGRKNN